MPAQLLALDDSPNILLDKPILLVGRDPECDIQLDSRKISRRHCCIAQVHDYFVVRDLGSTNGVRINGVRVLEGKLKGGDELMIGGCKFQVSWDDLAPRASRPRHAAPRRARADDDSLLERADEPVPLADPNDSLPLDDPQPPPGRRPPPTDVAKPLLPEQIDLASLSDMKLPPPQPPS